jgi:hypothetical protein
MVFRSKYSNHVVSLPNGKKVTFVNGQLDTATACKQVGMSDEALIKALKAGKYFGRDYSAIEAEAPPAPKPPAPAPKQAPTPKPSGK